MMEREGKGGGGPGSRFNLLLVISEIHNISLYIYNKGLVKVTRRGGGADLWYLKAKRVVESANMMTRQINTTVEASPPLL